MANVMLAPSSLPGRLAFAPDGALLAAGAAVIDVPNGRVLRVFRGQLSPVTGAAFSPDGALLATGSFDGSIRVWGVADGAGIADIAIGTEDDWAPDVAFSPDGTLLAAACDDSETARLWDPRTGRALATFDTGADATCVDFSPDGRLLAVGSWSDTVGLWDVAAGVVTGALEGHESAVKDVAFSTDGRLLAAACLDGRTRIWEVARGTVLTTLAGHDEERGVTAVSFAPDGTLLATASNDGIVRVWDARTWAERLTLTYPGDGLSAEVAFSPDGRWIAAKSSGTVLIWDTATWAVHATITESAANGIALAVSADGSRLATACADRTVRVWDTATGTARTVLDNTVLGNTGLDHTGLASIGLPSPGEAVSVVEFTPDGTGLLTASGDGAVRRLDITVPAATVTTASEGDWGPVAAVSPGGRLVATTAGDEEAGTVRVWDTAGGPPRAVIAAADPWADPDDEYEQRVTEAAFSPDGALLVTTAMTGRSFVWDAATGAPHATLTGHDRGWPVIAVAFSPDGALIATGSLDWTARIWDTRDGTLRTTLTCDEAVTAVAFSPEGTLLATVSADRTVWVWDLATAKARTVIRSPDWVGAVAFLPGGRYLVTAVDTGTARIWDTGAGPETTVPAVTLVALAGDGYAALLPDGRYKLDGDAGDRLWWLDGLRRLTAGELDAAEGGSRRLPARARLLPDT